MPTFFTLSFELGEENERQENASKHVYMVSSLSEILYQKNISYPDFSTRKETKIKFEATSIQRLPSPIYTVILCLCEQK